MADRTPHEARLIELALRYLDADLDARETAELRAILDHDPEAGERFVELCIHARALTEPLHAANGAGAVATEPPVTLPAPRRRYVGLSVAAALLLATAVVAVFMWLASSPDSDALPGAGPVTAVVVAADGVRWNTEPRAAGDEIDTRAFAISGGRLNVELLGGSTMELIGPASAQLPSRVAAYLSEGAARFRTEPGFTVSTPGGVKIIDEGTAFAVWVEPDRPTRVETTEGRVRIEWPGGKPTRLEAGLAALADPFAETIDPIAFDQEPIVHVRPRAIVDEVYGGPVDAGAASRWESRQRSKMTATPQGTRVEPSADYLRAFRPIAPVRLDNVGDSIRVAFTLSIDRNAVTLGDANTVAIRTGLFDTCDTPADADDRGYRLDMSLGRANVPSVVALVDEGPGDGLLGGSVFGDKLTVRAYRGLDNAKPHRYVLQLQRTDAGLRALGWVDGQRVFDQTQPVEGDAPRFDRFGFGTGRLSGAFVVGNVTITSYEARN